MADLKQTRRAMKICRAITELDINTPIYRTVCRKDGTVEITTRDGTFTWRPSPAAGDPYPVTGDPRSQSDAPMRTPTPAET